tara:strand:- start:797 stop:1081 length:285 start_codon:yes stop_codon:yes gene_type:complete
MKLFIKLFASATIAAIFVISMSSFVLSFNTCLDSQEGTAIIDNHNIPTGTDIDEVVEPTNDISTGSYIPAYNKAELIVFNSDGDVIYNKIISNI